VSNKTKDSRRLPQVDGAPDAPLVASNYKEINRGTLLGTCNILVVRWRFVFRGCLLFEKNNKRWVNLPANSFVADDGQREESGAPLPDDPLSDLYR
jgi:hypothetical protein